MGNNKQRIGSADCEREAESLTKKKHECFTFLRRISVNFDKTLEVVLTCGPLDVLMD